MLVAVHGCMAAAIAMGDHLDFFILQDMGYKSIVRIYPYSTP